MTFSQIEDGCQIVFHRNDLTFLRNIARRAFGMTSEKTTLVTAAIIIQNSQVLITQRRLEDRMGGKWEFPGGKIEPGETPEACLQRELQEELGILTDIHQLYAVNQHAYLHLKIELQAYLVTIRGGQLTLFEHQDYR